MSYKEKVLEDNYPIYYSYFYVIDGQVTRNINIFEGIVLDLKKEYNALEIKSCDIVGRNLFN